MMELLHEARTILETSGYSTHTAPQSDIFYFEDDILVGVTSLVDSPRRMINEWTTIQDNFLKRYGSSLRRSSYKSWNAYTICLTPGRADESERLELLKIEEDFRGSRKIMKTGIITHLDVVGSLLPIIRIQNFVELKAVETTNRLRARLADLPSDAVQMLLSNKPLDDVANALREMK